MIEYEIKIKKIEKFRKELAKCNRCTNLRCSTKSLINIYDNFDFCRNIPSIWTDWENRLDKKIMIIGQDWGPYNEMKKIYDYLKKDKSNWKELIDSEKSNTKKMLEKYICFSSKHKYSLEDAYITNAILCARKGDNYRGNNIDLKNSTLNCKEHLLRQIEIVQPQVILTLGYFPLLALSKIFSFQIRNTLKETIAEFPEIHVKKYHIIPLYHPVAQIKKEEQLKQYERIWQYLNEKL